MEFKIKKNKNYEGNYKNKKEKIEMPCFTKKQVKEKIKTKEVKCVGEIGISSGVCIGTAKYDDSKIPVYRPGSYNAWIEDIKGYVLTTDNDYLALIKNVLLIRIFILFLILLMPFVLIKDVRSFIFDSIKNMIRDEQTIDNSKVDLDENAEDWKGVLPTDDDGKVPTSGIRIPGYKEIRLKANTTKQRVSLVNPIGNPCYFKISFVLIDTNEVIYSSKMIEPGKGLYNIKLDKKLKPGIYKMSLRYETLSLESLEPLNGANVNLDLIVN